MTKKESSGYDIQVYENDIEYYFEKYFEDHPRIDRDKFSPSQFTSALRYIHKNLHLSKSALLIEPYYTYSFKNKTPIKSNGNKYNLDKINEILDIYINLCNDNNNRVSIIGFSYLTGISPDTLYKWRDDDRQIGESGTTRSYLFKKLYSAAEYTLNDILMDKSTNPMKATVLLNNQFGYSDKRTVTHEGVAQIAPTTREGIAAELGLNLEDNHKI